MDIDTAQVRQDVIRAFEDYEKALCQNDVAALRDFFFTGRTTIRYGEAENLYGSDAIHAFRLSRPSSPRPRTLLAVHVTTFGETFAIANAEFQNQGEQRLGRQSQTWAKIDGKWRIVCAHVSYMADGGT